MLNPSSLLRNHARSIWQSAIAAVDPFALVRAILTNPPPALADALAGAGSILVVGGGKAGAAMAAGVEEALANQLDRVSGTINVPATTGKTPVPPARTGETPVPPARTGEMPVPPARTGETPVPPARTGETPVPPARTGETPVPPARTGEMPVPPGTIKLRAIRLHAARPAGSNQPTAEGVAGVRAMLDLVAQAGPHDVGLCLLSGGGSALLPAPVAGISLEDKQQVTALLHACGATINEMNCVRKHLSAIKGGRLAQAFGTRPLFSLIISDVIGDPLDVIASGPTAPDPTTFADALAILDRYELLPTESVGPASRRSSPVGPASRRSSPVGPASRRSVSPAVRTHLERGRAGDIDETPKMLPSSVQNLVLGNNSRALAAAQRQAEALGYTVLNLGSYIEGETRQAAVVLAGIARSIRADGQPLPPPLCLLCGGETTVTLGPSPGRGGRNQEFVLAATVYLGAAGLKNMVVLSGGTDGEDGPTDAAGALADQTTLTRAAAAGLDPAAFLERHDAYSFFEATGDLLKTGLTQTNVMDVRILLVGA